MKLLWRPSTVVFLGAGLLAADPLRWLLAPWTDATLPAFVRIAAVIVMFVVVAFRVSGRRRRGPGREVEVLVLPPRCAVPKEIAVIRPVAGSQTQPSPAGRSPAKETR